jgi:NitT/TauT family transport system substrate-binding protein
LPPANIAAREDDVTIRTSLRARMRIAVLALSACVVATAASAQSGKPWRHGTIEAKSDAGFFFMTENGFAEKQGLKLEIVQFKTDIIALQAMLAGEIDSFEGGPGGSMIATSRGGDMKIIGCQWPGLPYGIFVPNSINSLADLKGKTFAISAPSANPAVVARGVLEKYGVPASSVNFANLGSDLDRFKAVVAGVAAAAIVSDEYEPIAEKQNVKMLVAARDALPDYIRQCIMTSGKTLTSRADDAAHFLAAEMSALQYAVTHRTETLALTRKLTNIKPDDPRPEFVYDDAVRSHAVDPALSLPMNKLEWMKEQLVKDGSLTRPVDLAKVVDPTIRAKAAALVAH